MANFDYQPRYHAWYSIGIWGRKPMCINAECFAFGIQAVMLRGAKGGGGSLIKLGSEIRKIFPLTLSTIIVLIYKSH